MMTMIWFLRPPLLHFFILSYPSVFSQGSFFVSNPPLGMCGFRIFCSWHNAKRGRAMTVEFIVLRAKEQKS